MDSGIALIERANKKVLAAPSISPTANDRPPDAWHGVGDRPVDKVRRDVEEHRAAKLQDRLQASRTIHSATSSVSSPRRVKVGRRLGGAASSIVGEGVEQRLEGDKAFHARQGRAQAVMDAAAEGHVLAGVAGDVQSMRLGEGGGIAVGRSQDQQDFVSFPDLVAEEVEILHGDALGDLYRPVEAQELVDRRADQLGPAPQAGRAGRARATAPARRCRSGSRSFRGPPPAAAGRARRSRVP